METFRRDWRGWIRSSAGYSVRLKGRTRLQYRDALGELEIFAEPMNDPWTDIVVDTSAIPDMPDRARAEVVDGLQRAFAYVGWTLIEAGRGDTGMGDR